MKIFIFEINEYWEYCAGGAVVIAENFEEAQKLIKEFEIFEAAKHGFEPAHLKLIENKVLPLGNMIYYHERSKYVNDIYGTDETLVLVGEFDLAVSEPPRVVTYSYNNS